jgi:cytochrome c
VRLAVRLVAAGALAIVGSLLLARAHPFGVAGLFAEGNSEADFVEHSAFPPEVGSILAAKCGDCHSAQTRAPIYGRFAPVSWLMERDILHGREAMNLARWDTYPASQRQVLAAKIVQEAKSHAMPPLQYVAIHRSARVTDAEVRTLAIWARTTSELEAGVEQQPAGEGDPGRGKVLFDKRCSGCHALTVNHQGPQLQGVYGRTSGTASGYAYSEALKKAKIVWDDKSLDKWLTDPDAFIAGNNMDFLVSKPQERLDLIRYLRQVSGK